MNSGVSDRVTAAYHWAMTKPPATIGRILTISAALLAGAVASAQEPTADQIISGMQETLDATSDASFLVTGQMLGSDGTVYQLELEVEAMPQEGLLRLFIIQPDALADNFIIVTPEELYNYNYLTNQIVVYDADDPQAYGPLAGDSEGSFELTLDLASLFAGWQTEVVGTVDTDNGPATELELTNLDPGANIASATVVALQDGWFPQRIDLRTSGGEPMLSIELDQVVFDSGLSADDLLWYPPDAEVIDER